MEEIKFLHVDDDSDFLSMAEKLIKKDLEGAKLVQERNPLKAAESIKDGDFDCVLCDYDMPELNGIELLEEVRKDFPDLPFILLTGKGSEELASKAISHGVTDYVRKRDLSKNRDVVIRRIKNSVQKRRAEKALKESEEKYRTLVEEGGTAVYIYKGDRFLFVNRKVEEITGYRSEELLKGKSPLDLIHPEDRDRLKGYIKSRNNGKEAPSTYTAKILTKNGETRYCKFNVSSVTYNGEKAYIGSVNDITKQIETKKRLEESKKKFESVYKNANDGILLIKNSEFVDCNSKIAEMLGYEKEELIGKKPSHFSPEFQPDGVKTVEKEKEKIKKAMSGKNPVFEWQFRDSKGEDFLVEVSLNRMNIKGEVWIQAIIRDVSRTQRAIEPLHQVSRELMKAESVQEVLDIASNAAESMLGFDGTSIRRYNGQNEKLEFVSLGGTVEDIDERPDFDIKSTPHGKAFKLGETLIDDIGEEDDLDREVFNQTMYVPIGEYGVLSTGITEGSFSEKDRKLAEILAKNTESALEKVELLEEVKKKETESKEKFKALFEHANDAIFLMKEDKFIDCNPKTEEIFGCNKEEIIGKPPYKFSPAEQPDGISSKEKAMEKIQAAMKGEPQKFEWKHKTADGELFDAEVSLNKVEIDDEVLIQAVVRDISKKKDRERALMESEKKYSTLVEEANSAVTIFKEGRIVFANSKTADLLDISEERLQSEVIGEPFSKFVTPEEREIIIERHKKRIRGEEVPDRYESKALTPAGKEKNIELNLSEIEFEGKKAVMAVIVDITDTKEREKRILDMQRATRNLLEEESKDQVASSAVKAANKVFDHDVASIHFRDGDVLMPVESNSKASEIFQDGLNNFEKGSDVWRIFEGKESVLIDDIQSSEEIKRQSPVQSSLLMPLGDHGIFIISSTEKEAFSEEDKQIGELFSLAVSAALDRAEFEYKLKEERDRFAALFNNIPDPTVFLDEGEKDEEAIIRDVNPAFERVFGYERDRVIGEPIDSFVTPEEAMDEAKKYNKMASDGKEIQTEGKRLTADGEKDFLIRSAIIKGESVGYAIYTDITDQKEREREINRQKERLEKFASVLSHDIRNPLNIAQGYVEIARESECEEGLTEIESAHERIESIIESMLELARKGQNVQETEQVSLREMAKEAWSMISGEKAHLIIEEDIKFRADRSRALRIFENILGNAVEHGGSDLNIRVGQTEGGSGFYIENDGEPIPEEKKEDIFEYGFSGEGGTGFGLAIVKSIVQAHGWSIEVKDSKSGGPRFEVKFLDSEQLT